MEGFGDFVEGKAPGQGGMDIEVHIVDIVDTVDIEDYCGYCIYRAYCGHRKLCGNGNSREGAGRGIASQPWDWGRYCRLW